MFDENLLTNEDYEFQYPRPEIGLGGSGLTRESAPPFMARDTLGALAKHYWRYGYWESSKCLRRYPDKTLRWRQALPSVFVAGWRCWSCSSPFWNVAFMDFVDRCRGFTSDLKPGGLPACSQ